MSLWDCSHSNAHNDNPLKFKSLINGATQELYHLVVGFKDFKFSDIHKVEVGVRNMVIGTVNISELSTLVFKLSLEYTFL